MSGGGRCVQCSNQAQSLPVGTTRSTAKGYISVKTAEPNVWVSQHRHVMESVLGRALGRGENVHHKNGDRHDNRPENLELWVSYQPSGQRPTDLLEWADEIIRRYR